MIKECRDNPNHQLRWNDHTKQYEYMSIKGENDMKQIKWDKPLDVEGLWPKAEKVEVVRFIDNKTQVIVLVTFKDKSEYAFIAYTSTGNSTTGSLRVVNKIKHVAYINLYENGFGGFAYETEEKAKKDIVNWGYIRTVKVEEEV
jgi:hypothetical protein